MDDRPFIGMGQNPDGPDLPLGLSMHLAQEPDAISNFGRLTKEQKAKVIDYVQGAATGAEAEAKILRAVHRLKEDDYGGIFSGS